MCHNSTVLPRVVTSFTNCVNGSASSFVRSVFLIAMIPCYHDTTHLCGLHFVSVNWPLSCGCGLAAGFQFSGTSDSLNHSSVVVRSFHCEMMNDEVLEIVAQGRLRFAQRCDCVAE